MRWLLGFSLHSGIHLRSSSATSLAALPSGYRAKGGRANVVWHGLGGLCLISSSETSNAAYSINVRPSWFLHGFRSRKLCWRSCLRSAQMQTWFSRPKFEEHNGTYLWMDQTISRYLFYPFLAILHQILWIGGFSNFFVNGSLPRRFKDSFYFTAVLGYTDINCLDFPGWQSNHATHCWTILKMPPYRTCNS